MEKLNHTPGPWPNHGGDNHSIDIILPNDTVISMSRSSRYSDEYTMSRDEMNANARLIAKSPDLLAHHIKDIENLRGLMQIVDASAAQIIQAMIDQKEALLNSI